MGNTTAGGGAVMVPEGIDYGDSEEIDLHLVEWGEENPFFEVSRLARLMSSVQEYFEVINPIL